jgi:hypothetical protein
VAIAWTLRHPAVTAAIVGMRSAKHVEGVIGAAEFRLSPEEVGEIARFPPPPTAALLAIDIRSATCHLGICARVGLLRRNRRAPEWPCGRWKF